MIINISHFQNQLNSINEEIYNQRNNLKFNKRNVVTNFLPKSLTKQYNNWTINFPFDIIPASNSIILTNYCLELNYLIFEFSEGDERLSHEIINLTKLKRETYECEPNDIIFINDIIFDLIHSFIYKYKRVLKKIIKEYIFDGINDEKVILKNLLKLYKGVLENPDVQINIFHSIVLTKKISDSIIELIIDFINHRLETLEPETNNLNTTIPLSINSTIQKTDKIKWLGKQQDLIELFVELAEKKWIENPDFQKMKKYCESILGLFDIEYTKRKESSNTFKSFYQKFKGDNINGKKVYPFLENKNYKRKYDKIENNKC
jgi:hypothetical protein